MTTTTAPVFMLKGDALVEFVYEKMQLVNRNEMTRTEMILDAGYVYDNGKAMYTQFYVELLNARGITPTTNTDIEDQEYDDLSNDDKDLYDKITEMLGEKWTHEETIEFMDELEDIGIETASELEDAYEYTHDSYSSYAEKEFAEYFCIEVMDAQIPDIVLAAVDWQDVWDHNLRYDFNSIETVNGTFFFRNN
jgi:nuclear transport factor 2 (NTF2) superfamily protein